ncbi:methyltransferase [Neptuniibacter sp. QD34_54]|uniref:methyltransferase n=1 Tax=Neptuniibacter sp. QD34_54 TaxID=3398208 RepID=UPI0039F4B448
MNIFETPFGQFSLSRYPRRKNEQLRAWDAADEYLLNQIDQEEILANPKRILIINDQFGGLSIVLNDQAPTVVSDSWLAHAGIKHNAADNEIDAEAITLCNSLDYPTEPFDLVLIKIPKSLAMLEDQLIRLRPLLTAETKVIGGGMVKSIHTSTLKLFEKYLGPTKTSLAKKKARLIFPEIDLNQPQLESPYPSDYILENTQHKIINHAGVFSRDSLDIGTRFSLQHLPDTDSFEDIIDLGCGNGVVGLIAAEKNPSAAVHFVDESFMAVASAEANFREAFGDSRKATFQATDCLAGIQKNSCDLVLNNPPFHQQNVVGDFIAQQMFRESHKVLRSGGELWVIGNRHLGYHVALKKIFKNCETIANNKKFVILKAIKR